MNNSRTVLISGCSKGLGFELASILKSKGWNVITMGFRTISNVDICCDLLDLVKLKELIPKILGEKKIDLLICNAGGGKVQNENLNETELNKYFMEKNYTTTKNFIEAAEPYLDFGNCSIIGISSIAALKEIEGAPKAYSRAKRELNFYIKNKAKELAHRGIRVNLISPGNVYFEGSRWEEIEKNNPSFVREMLSQRVPFHSFISPSEIVDAILFLHSNSGRNITGNNLVIDGGQIL